MMRAGAPRKLTQAHIQERERQGPPVTAPSGMYRDWGIEPAHWYEVKGLSMMGTYTDIRPFLAVAAVAGYFLWKKFK